MAAEGAKARDPSGRRRCLRGRTVNCWDVHHRVAEELTVGVDAAGCQAKFWRSEPRNDGRLQGGGGGERSLFLIARHRSRRKTADSGVFTLTAKKAVPTRALRGQGAALLVIPTDGSSLGRRQIRGGERRNADLSYTAPISPRDSIVQKGWNPLRATAGAGGGRP
jgi:hypothetical protein